MKFESTKKELHDLKIQMVYQEGLVENVEAELAVLRKRLREVEDDLRRSNKLLDKGLVMRWDLKDKVEDLKHSLVLAGAGSLKFEGSRPS